MCFNFASGSAGSTFFGPAHWHHNALVTGYSRGKLWRTKLVKTDAGYVAHTDLLATMQQMLVDVRVSPRGDLILATHSGQPDWGSGPNGKGKLWRVRYADQETPQPVLAWNASPTELKIAFDRPLDTASLKDFAGKARIEGGQFVFPGDRFETIRPGYQVIYDQLAAPRYVHEILTTQLSPDRRTLALVTRPRLLVLDEPTEGIQPSVIKDIGRAIRTLKEQSGLAILLVEQYLDFCRELADRVYIMDRGEIVFSGSAEDLDRPEVRKHLTV